MKTLPQKVTLIEVGTRDGFQFEKQIVPTAFKLEIINSLADAGLKNIQATSFVHPRIVPQMADAEELVRNLPEKKDVIYSALVLNTKGLERAFDAGITCVEVSISASESHSRKNSGMSLDEAIVHGREMVRLAKKYGMYAGAGIQCALGCVYDGEIPTDRVLTMIRNFIKAGADRLSIADTTGMATPLSIRKLMDRLTPEIQGIPVVFHLHDTRGLGLVNVMTAMEYGITHFDTALGGMGGCPFVVGASGNIATEDTAHLMASLNIETRVDIARVSECSRRLSAFFGKMFSGKIYRLD